MFGDIEKLSNTGKYNQAPQYNETKEARN